MTSYTNNVRTEARRGSQLLQPNNMTALDAGWGFASIIPVILLLVLGYANNKGGNPWVYNASKWTTAYAIAGIVAVVLYRLVIKNMLRYGALPLKHKNGGAVLPLLLSIAMYGGVWCAFQGLVVNFIGTNYKFWSDYGMRSLLIPSQRFLENAKYTEYSVINPYNSNPNFSADVFKCTIVIVGVFVLLALALTCLGRSQPEYMYAEVSAGPVLVKEPDYIPRKPTRPLIPNKEYIPTKPAEQSAPRTAQAPAQTSAPTPKPQKVNSVGLKQTKRGPR